jgi:hypothetical protein
MSFTLNDISTILRHFPPEHLNWETILVLRTQAENYEKTSKASQLRDAPRSPSKPVQPVQSVQFEQAIQTIPIVQDVEKPFYTKTTTIEQFSNERIVKTRTDTIRLPDGRIRSEILTKETLNENGTITVITTSQSTVE